MISAIDTNILLDILIPNERFVDGAIFALEEAASKGSLVVADIVYAEVCVHFAAQRECELFFSANTIRVEPLTSEAHFMASRMWRRSREQGGKRTPIMADFLVGAHAQVQADRLLTRDRGFYRSSFPLLSLFDPTAE